MGNSCTLAPARDPGPGPVTGRRAVGPGVTRVAAARALADCRELITQTDHDVPKIIRLSIKVPGHGCSSHGVALATKLSYG
jgi:hypothetical protein